MIGAGFDTRAYRLDGGRWLEIDEPNIIAHKEARLPAATANNPLERLPIAFGTESLRSRIEPFREERRTLVVIEGVFMYLGPDQRRELLATLRDVFPDHLLYCDLMTRRFMKGYSAKLHVAIQELGATFTELMDAPETEFLAAGYTAVSTTSIVDHASPNGAR